MTTEKSASSGAFLARLLVGLAQGLALYVVSKWRLDTPLFDVGKETWPHVVEMARTVAALAPLPLYFGIGNLPARRLVLWTGVAAAVLAAVGWMAPAPVWSGAPPVITVWLFSLIVLYISHEFIQAAFDEKRPIASYATYFDLAWRHAFQAALALGFALAFWIVLWLGAALFRLIGIDALERLLGKGWFALPALATAFALGVHWTDASAGLTRGARQIGLALLSWLAILLTLILSAFLLALPFTGLEPLWDTKRATVLLLNAAATMILLINAAFQAGDPPRSVLMRLVVRFSALPLAGVVGLAALGLWLRVNQYGFTPARVLAGAELFIVAFYAAGYVWAALKPGAWLEAIKGVNIAGAAVVAAILLALMTPLLDPARVSVADQMARLESGRVEPDDFDFGFLANERSSHWGPKALKRLAAMSGSERNDRIAVLAQNPGAQTYGANERQTFNERRASLKLVGASAIPENALLPPLQGADPIGLCVSAWKEAVERQRLSDEEARRALRLGRRPAAAKPVRPEDLAPPATPEEARCLVRLTDLDFDGDNDILLLAPGFDPKFPNLSFWALTDERGTWRVSGQSRGGVSLPADDDWRDDRARLEPAFSAISVMRPQRRDFIVDGRAVRWFPTRARLTAGAMAAAVDTRGKGAAPAALLVDDPIRNPVIACADGLSVGNGTYLGCYGLRLDADGDGAPEFVVVSFSEMTPSLTVYRETASGVEALGEGQGAWRDWQARWDPKTETQSAFLSRERAATVDAMTTAPTLLGDLDVAGARLMFDYAAQACETPGLCMSAVTTR